MPQPVVIGTRGSPLARWQAQWVRAALQERFPGTVVELNTIKTQGDKILNVPLAKVGGKGLFVKEIEEALLAGHVDIAVHSMKDMPADLPQGLAIGAVPERESPLDVLISRDGCGLIDLAPDSLVGTSSLRRAAQLRHRRPDLRVVPLRGNLDTRLRKLETEGLAAVVLAAAGVRRLGLAKRISEHLDPGLMLPAVGQGALCIEIRRGDPHIGPMVAPLDHPATRAAVSAERSFLRRLEGGCQVPIAGHATVDGETLRLTGLVAEVDGSALIRHALSGPARSAARLGAELAEVLLSSGADALLAKLAATSV
ncbi:MAG: hydroxymethylbilane synthase [Desulfobacterales bacterium]